MQKSAIPIPQLKTAGKGIHPMINCSIERNKGSAERDKRKACRSNYQSKSCRRLKRVDGEIGEQKQEIDTKCRTGLPSMVAWEKTKETSRRILRQSNTHLTSGVIIICMFQ
jgi:hypothetical protein